MEDYPTKEQILAHIETLDTQKIPKRAIELTRNWKIKHFSGKWAKSSADEKKRALTVLIHTIYSEFLEKPLFFSWDDNDYWYYRHDENRINGSSESISIISALHELGHAFYGSSELHACSFSVHVFKSVFPKQYDKLTWDGHMLKK